jgi:hypothetical protein
LWKQWRGFLELSMPFKCEKGPAVLNSHASENILNEWKRWEEGIAFKFFFSFFRKCKF